MGKKTVLSVAILFKFCDNQDLSPLLAMFGSNVNSLNHVDYEPHQDIGFPSNNTCLFMVTWIGMRLGIQFVMENLK